MEALGDIRDIDVQLPDLGGLPTVTGLLERLMGMGILEKIPLWKTRGSRYYFKHRSPLLSMIYYIDQKLNIGEGIREEIDRGLILGAIGKELQFSLGEMLAERAGGRRGYAILPNGEGDIDIVLLDPRGKNPIMGYEVKIGGFEKREAEKAVRAIHSYGIPRAGPISANAKPPSVPGSYEELGPEDLVEMAERIARGLIPGPGQGRGSRAAY